jgi:F-type H+-transporting ATPase subunit gamma
MKDLQRRLETLSSLEEAISALRSLSAHHLRQTRQTLPAARAYRSEIETILTGIGVSQQTEPAALPGILAIGSDLGLCGDYSLRVSLLAAETVRETKTSTVYCVGRRLRGLFTQAGITPHRFYESPASLGGLPPFLLALSQDVLNDYAKGKFSRLQVVSARFDGIGKFQPLLTNVLPIAASPTNVPAIVIRTPYVERGHLFGLLVREFLYISLYELLLDALAAEYGMRLMASENAVEWLEKTLQLTRRRLAACRSEAATQEVLDIVTGRARPHRQAD